jgi:hypothetical protein
MTEADIQKTLATLLDSLGLLWTATANGGKRDRRTGASLKAQGVKPGVPDIIIFSPPPLHPDKRGCMIELKRPKGLKKAKGRLSAHQRIWLDELSQIGWIAEVAYGYELAISILIDAGYLAPQPQPQPQPQQGQP